MSAATSQQQLLGARTWASGVSSGTYVHIGIPEDLLAQVWAPRPQFDLRGQGWGLSTRISNKQLMLELQTLKTL